ncbi:MAG: transcription antitermination factor NusB [bacterium]
MGARRKARVLALQVLYIFDLCKLSAQDAFDIMWLKLSEPDKIKSFCHELSIGAAAHVADIDALIIKYAENWELNRMAAIDRNLLRLASYELLFYNHTPVSVVIDEAVEIAKEYSTPDSGKFVNGILDKIKSEKK